MSNHSKQSLFTEASILGDLQKLIRLLPDVNPAYNDSYALQSAAKYNNSDCVKFLIPLSDAKCDDSLALTWALRCRAYDCVLLLEPVSDIMRFL